MVYDKVRELLAAQLEIPEETIAPETRIMEDLHADSLDIVEIIMMLEEEYGLVVTDEEIISVQTVGEIAEKIEELLENVGQ